MRAYLMMIWVRLALVAGVLVLVPVSKAWCQPPNLLERVPFDTSIAFPDLTDRYKQYVAPFPPLRPAYTSQYVWLDDSRVFFSAMVFDNERRLGPSRYIWDVDRGKIEPFGEGKPYERAALVCSRGDIVVLRVVVDQRKAIYDYYEGRVGEPLALVTEVDEKGVHKMPSRNPWSCIPAGSTLVQDLRSQYRRAEPLGVSHGVVDWGRFGEDPRVPYNWFNPKGFWLRKDGGREVFFPRSQAIEMTAVTQFAPFVKPNGVYVLTPSGIPSEMGRVNIGMLDATAETLQTLVVPEDLWRATRHTGVHVVLTVAGLIWINRNFYTTPHKYLGGFLEVSGKTSRVIEDLMNGGVGVSPNGCRVAYFTHAVSMDPDRRNRTGSIRAVDLCAKSS